MTTSDSVFLRASTSPADYLLGSLVAIVADTRGSVSPETRQAFVVVAEHTAAHPHACAIAFNERHSKVLASPASSPKSTAKPGSASGNGAF